MRGRWIKPLIIGPATHINIEIHTSYSVSLGALEVNHQL